MPYIMQTTNRILLLITLLPTIACGGPKTLEVDSGPLQYTTLRCSYSQFQGCDAAIQVVLQFFDADGKTVFSSNASGVTPASPATISTETVTNFEIRVLRSGVAYFGEPSAADFQLVFDALPETSSLQEGELIPLNVSYEVRNTVTLPEDSTFAIVGPPELSILPQTIETTCTAEFKRPLCMN